MNKVIEYIIGAKDATGNAIKSALSRLKSFAASVGSNLMNIKAGFEMLGSAANKAMDFMRKAFAFETMTVQFKTLIGNMDEARAWGWYRNKDQWKAQLAEEKANAEAEAQFEKEARSLMKKTRWRTRELKPDEEIVRRVALAREDVKQAEDYARRTAQDTARAANALETIEQAITEGNPE